MKTKGIGISAIALLALAAPAAGWAAEATVETVVYASVGKGYKREKAKDGSFKPEYYALSNGGMIAGTTTDLTVDRVTYPEVAKMAMKLLAQQGYQYAKSKEQAKLLLVLNWGTTIAPNGMNKQQIISAHRDALDALGGTQYRLNNPDPRNEDAAKPVYEGQNLAANATGGFNRSPQWATNEEMAVVNAAGSVENSLSQSLTHDRVRDQLNQTNARVLGYQDELADANDIRRHAGGGNRYDELITDVEESRYYIVISAYDFKELTARDKKKLQWQVRVSVRSPGNAFDESLEAMLKSAAKYFGQSSGRLVRNEETKGTVKLGELKYLGEMREASPVAIPAMAIPTTLDK